MWFLSERKGKVIPCRWTKNRKGSGTNSRESSARNLETVSIRSRAQSTGGCVKLNTITGGSNQPPQQKTAVVGMGQINNPSTTARVFYF